MNKSTMKKTNLLIIIFAVAPFLLLLLLLLQGCASQTPSEQKSAQAEPDSKHHEHMAHDSHGSHDAHHSHDQHHAEHESHEQHGDHGAHHLDASQYTSREHAVIQTTENGLYKVKLFSNESPIPLQKIHSWTLHIETADGKPAENLKVYVNGGMPMHRHGFPTKPTMSAHLANGDYRVDGIKFNMPGHWEMRFNITEVGVQAGRGKKDRVIFTIHLK